MPEPAGRELPPLPVAPAKTLANGLDVLAAAVAAGAAGRTVSELARDTGLHRTVVHRLVVTLADRRLLRRLPGGRFAVGLGALDLAAAVHTDLQGASAGPLMALAEDLGATAHLSVLDGDHVVSVATHEPRTAHLHVAYRVGTRHRADVGAAGLAILLGRDARPHERPDVTTGRRRGYAVTVGEIQPGAWGLAAPVPYRTSPVDASVGVVALHPMDERRVAPAVLAAAAAVGAALAR
jgi:DNA-binding IclR family transcriptional regulator